MEEVAIIGAGAVGASYGSVFMKMGYIGFPLWQTANVRSA